RWSAPIGTASKFEAPTVDNGRLYLGTRDGKVLAFGAPVTPPLSGSAGDFGNVVIGQSSTKTVTLTANHSLTVSSVAASKPVFSVGATTPALPTGRTAGQTVQVPVTFKPTAAGQTAATLDVQTSAGPFQVSL